MSIRARILALVGCFAAMALVVTFLGLTTIGDYNRMMRDYNRAYENAWRGERLNHLVSNVVMETRGLYIARSDAELQSFVGGLDRNLDELEVLMRQWKGKEAALVAGIESDVAAFIALRRDVAQLAGAGKTEAAYARSTGSRSDRIAFQGKVEGIVQKTLNELNTAKQRADQFNQQRAFEFLAACLVGIAMMAGLSLWIIAQFITKPLRALASAIIRTSKGEYELPLDVQKEAGEAKDEVASVWQALAVLKERAVEAERLARAQREAERLAELKLRELVLD